MSDYNDACGVFTDNREDVYIA